MSQVFSFPPIASPAARILVLGSMPGLASLQAGQYYAHPRNLFWPFMERLFGISRELPYSERCRLLQDHGIAIWDVLQSCTRPGSLDSAIAADSMIANDFDNFLGRHRQIEGIYFNGNKAAESWRRLVLPALSVKLAAIPGTRLPSTSPANASIRPEEKFRQWEKIRHD